MKMVRLIKMCLEESYSRVRLGNHLCDMFPIRMLSKKELFYRHCFSTFLDYAISRVQVNKDDLKLNGKHQILVYADYVNIFGGSVYTIKKNADTVVFANKENGLEVNVDKTKYMAMYRDHNTGRSHSIDIDNNFLERVEEFKFGNNFNKSKFYSERK